MPLNEDDGTSTQKARKKHARDKAKMALAPLPAQRFKSTSAVAAERCGARWLVEKHVDLSGNNPRFETSVLRSAETMINPLSSSRASL